MISKPLLRQLLYFVYAGIVGFIVDAGVLYGALYMGLGFYTGRAISYVCATTATWAINRSWAFKETAANDNKKREWGRFVLFNTGGFAVNYGTYVACLHLIPLTQTYPFLAVGAGSIAGLFVNFTINKYLVFKAPKSVAKRV